MRKDRTTKMILNGVLVAAVAALGISAFQITKWEEQDPVQEVRPMETEPETQSEQRIPEVSQKKTGENAEQPLAAGTRKVEAQFGNPAEEDLLAGFQSNKKDRDQNKKTKEKTEKADTDTKEQAAAASTQNVVSAAEIEAAYRAPEINFSENTLMEWPLHGTILIDYSMDNTTYFPTLDQYKLSPAIAVGADEGAPVVSAVNGTVFTIEQNAQTGTTLTMDLGNGYQAIYGQLEGITVSEGETVTKGTTIGYVAAPTKYYDKEGANLYFAMKKDGQPIDPISYLP